MNGHDSWPSFTWFFYGLLTIQMWRLHSGPWFYDPDGPNSTCRHMQDYTCSKCGSHNCCRREIQTGWHNDHQDATLVGKAGSESRLRCALIAVIENLLLFLFDYAIESAISFWLYTEWLDALVALCPVPSFRIVFCWDGVAVMFHCSPWSKTTPQPYTARFYHHCKCWCAM